MKKSGAARYCGLTELKVPLSERRNYYDDDDGGFRNDMPRLDELNAEPDMTDRSFSPSSSSSFLLRVFNQKQEFHHHHCRVHILERHKRKKNSVDGGAAFFLSRPAKPVRLSRNDDERYTKRENVDCVFSFLFQKDAQFFFLFFLLKKERRSIPALRASRQASYMSSLMSPLSSAIVSPTRTKRSTAAWTARPTRPKALLDRSALSGRSGADTKVVICK